MIDAYWDPFSMCQPEDESAEMVYVAMDYIIRPVCRQNAPKVPGITPRPMRMQAGYDLRTERANLIVVGTRKLRVHEEIHSESVAVDETQHVHQPSFDPTSVHATDDVENTYRVDILACGVHKTALFR